MWRGAESECVKVVLSNGNAEFSASLLEERLGIETLGAGNYFVTAELDIEGVGVAGVVGVGVSVEGTGIERELWRMKGRNTRDVRGN